MKTPPEEVGPPINMEFIEIEEPIAESSESPRYIVFPVRYKSLQEYPAVAPIS